MLEWTGFTVKRSLYTYSRWIPPMMIPITMLGILVWMPPVPRLGWSWIMMPVARGWMMGPVALGWMIMISSISSVAVFIISSITRRLWWLVPSITWRRLWWLVPLFDLLIRENGRWAKIREALLLRENDTTLLALSLTVLATLPRRSWAYTLVEAPTKAKVVNLIARFMMGLYRFWLKFIK